MAGSPGAGEAESREDTGTPTGILGVIPGSRLVLGARSARRNLGAFQLRTATCFDLCIFAEARGSEPQVLARDAKGEQKYCPKTLPCYNHKTTPG